MKIKVNEPKIEAGVFLVSDHEATHFEWFQAF